MPKNPWELKPAEKLETPATAPVIFDCELLKNIMPIMKMSTTIVNRIVLFFNIFIKYAQV